MPSLAQEVKEARFTCQGLAGWTTVHWKGSIMAGRARSAFYSSQSPPSSSPSIRVAVPVALFPDIVCLPHVLSRSELRRQTPLHLVGLQDYGRHTDAQTEASSQASDRRYW